VTDFVASVRAVLAASFHEPAPEFEGLSGDQVARFRNPQGALGDAVVWVDRGELVVEIEGWTHHHYTGGESEMVAECVRWLELLFSDRVVVWGTAEWGGGSMTFAHGLDDAQFEEEFGDSPSSRTSTWSGRYQR
jgi:hypothetical protein